MPGPEDEEPYWPIQVDPMWAEWDVRVYEEAIRLARHGDIEMLLSVLRDEGPITVQSKRMVAELIEQQLKPKRAKKPLPLDGSKLWDIIINTSDQAALERALLQELLNWYIVFRRLKRARGVYPFQNACIDAAVETVRGKLNICGRADPSLLACVPCDEDLTEMLSERIRRHGTEPI